MPGRWGDIINNPTTFRWFAANVPFINGGETLGLERRERNPGRPDLGRSRAVIDIRPQNFAVEFTDGIDLDLSYDTSLFGGTRAAACHRAIYIGTSICVREAARRSRALTAYAQASDLRLNGSAVWGRGGFSIGSVGELCRRFYRQPARRHAGQGRFLPTASLFLGFDLSRLDKLLLPWLKPRVQLVAANRLRPASAGHPERLSRLRSVQ